MPSIIIKIPQTSARTAALATFRGFENKGGIKALQEGMDAAAKQAKDIVITRQQNKNTIAKYDFENRVKNITKSFMDEMTAESQRTGVGFDQKAVASSEELKRRIREGTEDILAEAQGGFKRELEFTMTKSVIEKSQELNFLDQKRDENRANYEIEKSIIPLFERGDIEAAEIQLAEYVKNKIITQAQADELKARAPSIRAHALAVAMGKESSTKLLMALRANDPAFAALTPEQRAQLERESQAGATQELTTFFRGVAVAKQGNSEADNEDPNSKLSLSLADAIKKGIITEADKLEIKSNGALKVTIRRMRELKLTGELEKINPALVIPEGEMSETEQLDFSANLVEAIIVAPPRSLSAKQKAASKLVLLGTDVDPAYIDYIENNILSVKDGGGITIEGQLWFGERVSMLAEATYKKAKDPAERKRLTRAYLEIVVEFHRRLNAVPKNQLVPSEIERIYKDCLKLAQGMAKESDNPETANDMD